MSTKKYENYTLAYLFGTKFFSSYRDAFVEYKRADAPKTLYGEDEMGEISVIMSN